MTSAEIKQVIEAQLGGTPGYDDATAQKFADALGEAMSIAAPGKKPTPGQQACYAKCEAARNAAMVACVLKPWPASLLCTSAAVVAFNACRQHCDSGGS